MSAVHDADRVLADIDAVLANKPIDLDDLLHHPGQLVVQVAKSSAYEDWLTGDIGDDELQELTDAYVDLERAWNAGCHRVACWLCDRYGDEFCEPCQTTWAAITDPGRVVHDAECLDDPAVYCWQKPGPEVDGISHRCARFHHHMATVK